MDIYSEEIEDRIFGTLVQFIGKKGYWTRRWSSPKLGDFEIGVEADEGTGPPPE